MKKQRTKASQYSVILDLIPNNARQECVATTLTMCLFSVLIYAPTAKFVWAQICVCNMRVSLLQVKGPQHHLGENTGPAIAGSARPALPALSERNECVKEAVLLKLFKVQSSNLKSLQKKLGIPGCLSRSASYSQALYIVGHRSGVQSD